MIFDVETTGLLNRRGVETKLEDAPYIVQLSYAMYDIRNSILIKTVDSYINIPEHVEIPKAASDVNGITRELCDQGDPMQSVLEEFYRDYHLANVIACHNYKFDSAMIDIEIKRHWMNMYKNYPYALNLFNLTYLKGNQKRYKCTMMDSEKLCKIPHANPKPQKEGAAPSYKWPTLAELYKHLFKEEQSGMHNSIIDVLITMRCYLLLETKYYMPDMEFNKLISNYMAPP